MMSKSIELSRMVPRRMGMSREGCHMPYMPPITAKARMAPMPAVSDGVAQPA